MAVVLVISFTDLKRDPRVWRQIDALRVVHDVVAAGTGDPEIANVKFVGCERAPRTFIRKFAEATELLLGQYETHYARLAHVAELRRKLAGTNFDVAIANDLEALPLALALAGRRPVILDAHEYAPRELEERAVWRIFKQPYVYYLCGKYLTRATRIITVADGIADEYARVFGIKPTVIRNAARMHTIRPRPTRSRPIRIIHHGHATPTRGLESMIEVIHNLDERFELDMMLVPTCPRYMTRLEALSRGSARVRFLPPVPMEEIVPFTSAYDIGLYLLKPSSFNNLHALPNKFFEFIQARLALAIGPSPEMARIVHEFDCGVVADDFSPTSLAAALSRLTVADIDRMKAGADRAARAHNAERNAEMLRSIVAAVLEATGSSSTVPSQIEATARRER